MSKTFAPTPVPDLPREFRAAWIATVDNIDWPSKPGLSRSELIAEMNAIFDVCQKVGLNAVIFQVRPSADSLYKSKIEPWSWYLTGEQGKAPEGDWDPLAYVVDEGHRRGLEVHVWCNPYRALHPAQKGPVSADHIVSTDPDLAKTYGTYRWMDPGEKKVQDRSFAVFMDLVERYDIDGLHIDDYFYPYKVKDTAGNLVDFPDQPSYDAYRMAGGKLDRGDWRRKNVDDFILRVYRGMKDRKKWVKFGISPFGIYRPGIPEGIKAGVDQYADLYADALKWFQKGWCDYFTPQLYWPIAQTPQSYPVLLKWWNEQNTGGRHLWPGNYTSRLNPGDGNWKPQELLDQIRLTRETIKVPGNVHFSMKALQRNWNGIADSLAQGPYANAALVPASPWLDRAAPPAPKRKSVTRTGVEWTSAGEPVRFYLIRTLKDRQVVQVKVTSETSWNPGEDAWDEMQIVALDRVGNASSALVIEPPR